MKIYLRNDERKISKKLKDDHQHYLQVSDKLIEGHGLKHSNTLKKQPTLKLNLPVDNISEANSSVYSPSPS